MSVGNGWWNSDRLQAAVKVIGSYPALCPDLLEHLSCIFGRTITYDSLSNALRRAGLGKPSLHLSTARDVVDVELGDFSDFYTAPTPTPADELVRILIVPDCHHRYVYKPAWDIVVASGKEFKPHIIVVLGDFGDFYATSRHRKDPNRELLLEHEVAACNEALDELDALGAHTKHFICGNHEDNLSRHLADHSPALFNMLSVEELFRLKERGWQFTPYGKYLQIGKAYYAHDPSGAGKDAHVRAAIKCGHPIIHGHTHRAAVAYMGNATGEKRFGIMAGWLGDPAQATYQHDLGKEHDWMHSFCVAYMEPDGVTHVQLVPIINGKACINGKIIRAAA